MNKEYNLADNEIVNLTLREIDFKIQGLNEFSKPKKAETKRTHSMDRVLESIGKQGSFNE